MASTVKIYKIKLEDYNTLKNTGTVTINGQTYSYDENALCLL